MKGRNRHVAIVTPGLPREPQVAPASVKVRDAVPPLRSAAKRNSPRGTMSFVDGGYLSEEAQSVAIVAVVIIKHTEQRGTVFIDLTIRLRIGRLP